MYRFLYNCVFCLAFLNFLIYWIGLFFDEKHQNNDLNHGLFNKSLSKSSINTQALPVETYNAKPWQNHGQYYYFFSFIINCSLWLVLTLLIFFRIIQSNHFPLANFYEALIFLTWCLVTLNLMILLEPMNTSLWERLSFYVWPTKQVLPKQENAAYVPQQTSMATMMDTHQPSFLSSAKKSLHAFVFKQASSDVLPNNYDYENQWSVPKQVSGAILAPCILFIIAFAQFNLTDTITPLVPALKSNWLLMHVSIMICSYTTFMVGGLLAFFLNMQTFYYHVLNKFNKSNVSFIMPSFFAKKNLLSVISTWRSKYMAMIQFFQAKNNVLPNLSASTLPKVSHLGKTYGLSPNVNTLFNDSSNMSFQAPSDILLHYLQVSSNTSTDSYGLSSSNTTEWYTNKVNNKKVPPLQVMFGNSSMNNNKDNQKIPNNLSLFSSTSLLEVPYKMQKKNHYLLLDNLSYRMMGIGFPLFTLGILSGAVWANEAWGSYWSWDIKEVGSFINWLLVALYFHCRYKNYISLSHVVAFISLMVLFFNFFGISLGIFGSSLHAYGASS